jgi:hypothetical protein
MNGMASGVAVLRNIDSGLQAGHRMMGQQLDDAQLLRPRSQIARAFQNWAGASDGHRRSRRSRWCTPPHELPPPPLRPSQPADLRRQLPEVRLVIQAIGERVSKQSGAS